LSSAPPVVLPSPLPPDDRPSPSRAYRLSVFGLTSSAGLAFPAGRFACGVPVFHSFPVACSSFSRACKGSPFFFFFFRAFDVDLGLFCAPPFSSPLAPPPPPPSTRCFFVPQTLFPQPPLVGWSPRNLPPLPSFRDTLYFKTVFSTSLVFLLFDGRVTPPTLFFFLFFPSSRGARRTFFEQTPPPPRPPST